MAGFVVPFMHHIALDGDQRIGFVTLKPEGPDALRLDHLYLRTGFQGLGIGEWVLQWAQSQACAQGRDIKLTALVKSDANRFYLRHGFVLEGEEGVDLHYRWRATELVS
jgi:GNAT superfamily N-acetyltransferase